MATIKDLKRMCKSFDHIFNNCPFYLDCCGGCITSLPDNADEIVDKWILENPVRTYAMDFFEKFPNAKRNEEGVPVSRGTFLCRKELYVDELTCIWSSGGCSKCWNQEMKEE